MTGKLKTAPKESLRTKKKQSARTPSEATASSLVRYAVKGIEEKKGKDIVCINLKKISNSACDYFVICEGNSRTHVQAIAGSVEEFVKKNTGSRPWHVEGLQNSEWVLMDYVNVAVHIFQPEVRSHYGLESMWADAEIKEMKLNGTPVKRKSVIKKKIKTKKKQIKRKK
ncbi:MAG: ribosome silencing factor [Bacteroidota bacterium]